MDRLRKVVLNPMSDFSHISGKAPDAIFHTKTQFAKDSDRRKLNLGVGAYRDDMLQPYVLPVVKVAEKRILAQLEAGEINKEYLPIGGDKEFCEVSQGLVLGDDCVQRRNGSVAGIQTLSGTGSLRVLGEFAKLFFPETTIWLSNPTWGNHKKIFSKAGLKQNAYRYWNPSQRNLDFDGMCADLKRAKVGDIVLLHMCAHNPTGVDPSHQEWNAIAELINRKGLIALFDCAYQGYGSDLIKDRYPVELFARKRMTFFIAQSYSKNMGLYGERVGCASVVCNDSSTAKAVNSQLCAIVRPMWSNPPKHGCYIAKTILSDPTLYQQWTIQLKGMVDRILLMRSSIRKNLEQLGTPGSWRHVTDQIGMFSYTGLTKSQVLYMRDKYHIYMLTSGRISIAGLSNSTVKYFCTAVDDAVRNA